MTSGSAHIATSAGKSSRRYARRMRRSVSRVGAVSNIDCGSLPGGFSLLNLAVPGWRIAELPASGRARRAVGVRLARHARRLARRLKVEVAVARGLGRERTVVTSMTGPRHMHGADRYQVILCIELQEVHADQLVRAREAVDERLRVGVDGRAVGVDEVVKVRRSPDGVVTVAHVRLVQGRGCRIRVVAAGLTDVLECQGAKDARVRLDVVDAEDSDGLVRRGGIGILAGILEITHHRGA